jgi:hypothetical protein
MKEELLQRIATHQKMRQFYTENELKQRLSKVPDPGLCL